MSLKEVWLKKKRFLLTRMPDKWNVTFLVIKHLFLKYYLKIELLFVIWQYLMVIILDISDHLIVPRRCKGLNQL